MYNILGVKCSGYGIKTKAKNKILKKFYYERHFIKTDNNIYINKYTKEPLKIY